MVYTLIDGLKFIAYNNTGKSNAFVSIQLTSSLSDLLDIVKEIDQFMPQLENFITNFNTTIAESGINVITDSAGNMELDVPSSLPDDEVKKFTNKISIIDRLINTRGQELKELFQKGIDIEKKLKIDNPDHVSYLDQKIEYFKKLNNTYKH